MRSNNNPPKQTMPDCIIAAAGRSRRMGKWKPGLPWKGSSMIETVIEAARGAGCRVIVVGGYRYRSLYRLLRHQEIELLRAPHWRYGMGASLHQALPMVQTPRFFVVPADMPLLRSEDFIRLARFPGKPVLRPVFSAVPGHPVLIDGMLKVPLRQSALKMPFRQILGEYEQILIEWDDARVILDLDTASAYREARLGEGERL